MKNLILKWNQVSLVKRILVGMMLGGILALTIPDATKWVTIFGSLFVGALKAVAPILVLFIVMHAISRHKKWTKNKYEINYCPICSRYILAGLVGVVASFIFPVTLSFTTSAKDVTPPGGILEVLKTLLFNIVDKPSRRANKCKLYWHTHLGDTFWHCIKKCS